MSAPEPERQAEQPEREERPYVSIEDKWKGEPPAVKAKPYDLTFEDACRLTDVAVDPVWSAPSDIRDVFLCPTCFTNLGVERGITRMWLVTPDIGGPINLAEQVTFVPNDDEEGRRFLPLKGTQQ